MLFHHVSASVQWWPCSIIFFMDDVDEGDDIIYNAMFDDKKIYVIELIMNIRLLFIRLKTCSEDICDNDDDHGNDDANWVMMLVCKAVAIVMLFNECDNGNQIYFACVGYDNYWMSLYVEWVYVWW